MPSGAFAYVGNDVDAAVFRLAGVRTWVPRAGEALAAFTDATTGSDAVFITSQVAEALPRTVLDAALLAERPLLVLVPDATTTSALDPAERVRAQLGIEG